MAWLHRTNKLYLPHLSPGDMKLRYPAEVFVGGDGNAVSNLNWIWNPDLSGVGSFASKYWNISGDVVSLMSQVERDALDAQEAADALTADQEENKARYDDEKILKALALVILDEINLLRAQHSLADRTVGQLRTTIRAKVEAL